MPKVVDVEEKRRRILSAAAGVFARHGYRGTNLQRVAVAAEMGKSSLYHYFATRDALFDALMQDLLRKELEVFEDLAGAAGRPSQRLEALIDAVTEIIGEWVKAGPLLIDCLQDERGRRALRLTLRKIRDALSKLVAQGQAAGELRGGDPRALATVVVGCLDGVLLQRLLEPAAPGQRAVDRELRETLLRGLGKGDVR